MRRPLVLLLAAFAVPAVVSAQADSAPRAAPDPIAQLVARLDPFGSAARDDFDAARSDLDFLVEFDESHATPGLDTYLRLKRDLARALGRPVDLLIPQTITNPYVKAGTASERLTVYAS